MKLSNPQTLKSPLLTAVHEFPSRAPPRGSLPHSTQRSAPSINDLLPPDTRGLAEPRPGDEKERSMTALGLFSFEHKEGALQSQRSWQGANFMAALQGWSPHISPQGGASSIKSGRNDKGGYRVPQDMAPPKAQESGLASGGVDAQGKRPPQDGSNCEVDPFFGRIAEHAVIRKCGLLREEASSEQRPEKQPKIAGKATIQPLVSLLRLFLRPLNAFLIRACTSLPHTPNGALGSREFIRFFPTAQASSCGQNPRWKENVDPDRVRPCFLHDAVAAGPRLDPLVQVADPVNRTRFQGFEDRRQAQNLYIYCL
jgi:hypothetical protein